MPSSPNWADIIGWLGLGVIVGGLFAFLVLPLLSERWWDLMSTWWNKGG